jgi:hypothetical protein
MPRATQRPANACRPPACMLASILTSIPRRARNDSFAVCGLLLPRARVGQSSTCDPAAASGSRRSSLARYRAVGLAQQWRVGSRALHFGFLLLLLCNLASVVRGTSCSSSPTCLAHAGDENKQCFVKGYSHFWGFDTSPFFKFAFPSKGLYTFVKTQKDTSDCCYDLEVQGFMCHVLREGSPVSTLRRSTPGLRARTDRHVRPQRRLMVEFFSSKSSSECQPWEPTWISSYEMTTL